MIDKATRHPSRRVCDEDSPIFFCRLTGKASIRSANAFL